MVSTLKVLAGLVWAAAMFVVGHGSTVDLAFTNAFVIGNFPKITNFTLKSWNPFHNTKKIKSKTICVSFVNGIYHSRDEWQEIADQIGESFGTIVRPFYYPSSGSYIPDAFGAGLAKIIKSHHLDIAKKLSIHLRDLITEVGPSGRVLHLCHSGGAILTYLAVKYHLTPEEVAQIDIVAFGGGHSLTHKYFSGYVINYYSKNDPVLLVDKRSGHMMQMSKRVSNNSDPITIVKEEKYNTTFAFLEGITKNPIMDHSMMGPTYKVAIQLEAQKFQERLRQIAVQEQRDSDWLRLSRKALANLTNMHHFWDTPSLHSLEPLRAWVPWEVFEKAAASPGAVVETARKVPRTVRKKLANITGMRGVLSGKYRRTQRDQRTLNVIQTQNETEAEAETVAQIGAAGPGDRFVPPNGTDFNVSSLLHASDQSDSHMTSPDANGERKDNLISYGNVGCTATEIGVLGVGDAQGRPPNDTAISSAARILINALNDNGDDTDNALAGHSSSSSSSSSSSNRRAIDSDSLFAAPAMLHLVDEIVWNVSVRDVIDMYWRSDAGFRSFLESQGDHDIKVGDWRPMGSGAGTEGVRGSGSGAGPVEGDLARECFDASRDVEYAHPRTTMLMFGPKSAKAFQSQHMRLVPTPPSAPPSCPASVIPVEGRLSVPLPGPPAPDSDSSARLSQALVLTVTKFQGIPMADCFQVLQYWSFEVIEEGQEGQGEEGQANTSLGGDGDGEGGADARAAIVGGVRVRVGVYVHFMKGCMFKGRIVSGVQEEVAASAKLWIPFFHALTVKH